MADLLKCGECGKTLKWATEIANGMKCAECGPGSLKDQDAREARGEARADYASPDLQITPGAPGRIDLGSKTGVVITTERGEVQIIPPKADEPTP